MIEIAIVEDNFSALHALEEKLSVFPEISIRFRASTGDEIISQLNDEELVQLILMDIEMPGLDGIQTTRIIKNRYPSIKVVILTIYDNDESIFKAIQAGADSYILKETKAEKIYETIHDTLRGGAVMSPSIAVKALHALRVPNRTISPQEESPSELSTREIEVLECLSNGLTNKRIAEQLFISSFTVKRHIENIYKKLQAQSRVELIDKGKRKGLI